MAPINLVLRRTRGSVEGGGDCSKVDNNRCAVDASGEAKIVTRKVTQRLSQWGCVGLLAPLRPRATGPPGAGTIWHVIRVCYALARIRTTSLPPAFGTRANRENGNGVRAREF